MKKILVLCVLYTSLYAMEEIQKSNFSSLPTELIELIIMQTTRDNSQLLIAENYKNIFLANKFFHKISLNFYKKKLRRFFIDILNNLDPEIPLLFLSANIFEQNSCTALYKEAKKLLCNLTIEDICKKAKYQTSDTNFVKTLNYSIDSLKTKLTLLYYPPTKEDIEIDRKIEKLYLSDVLMYNLDIKNIEIMNKVFNANLSIPNLDLKLHANQCLTFSIKINPILFANIINSNFVDLLDNPHTKTLIKKLIKGACLCSLIFIENLIYHSLKLLDLEIGKMNTLPTNKTLECSNLIKSKLLLYPQKHLIIKNCLDKIFKFFILNKIKIFYGEQHKILLLAFDKNLTSSISVTSLY